MLMFEYDRRPHSAERPTKSAEPEKTYTTYYSLTHSRIQTRWWFAEFEYFVAELIDS